MRLLDQFEEGRLLYRQTGHVQMTLVHHRRTRWQRNE
jgi:hypothetical protein